MELQLPFGDFPVEVLLAANVTQSICLDSGIFTIIISQLSREALIEGRTWLCSTGWYGLFRRQFHLVAPADLVRVVYVLVEHVHHGVKFSVQFPEVAAFCLLKMGRVMKSESCSFW